MYNRFSKKKRNVPFASLKQINDEHDRLKNMGNLSKVDWVSPTVYIKKVLRDMCLRMGINDTLKNYHYPLPELEEVFAQLNGDRIFSKIDLSSRLKWTTNVPNCDK